VRVLIVSQYFWPESFRINDLAAGLVTRGHDVTVLTGNPNYPGGVFLEGYGGWRPSRETRDGMHVIRVPHVARGSARGLRLIANYVSFALAASFLGPLLSWRIRPDVVFVNQLSPISVAVPGLVVARIRRVPAAMWIQDLWPESLLAVGAVRTGWGYGILRRLSAAIHRSFDSLFVQSEAFVAPLAAQGVPVAEIRYLPNWAESVYRPLMVSPDAPQRLEMPTGFKILFAGNIGVSQSFETVLDAIERLRDVEDLNWIVVGEGRRRAWLADQVRTRGLSDRVQLLGRRPVEEMPAYFGLADALLVSLRSEPLYALTIPSKIQSYLACGRPIVASLDGEGARIVSDAGAGVVADAENGAALAAAVLRLHAMSDAERAAMGSRGRAYYESHFERSIVIARAERYLTELMPGQAI
jgi:colanic acid biosynthesis glycosyl transferase WcaI